MNKQQRAAHVRRGVAAMKAEQSASTGWLPIGPMICHHAMRPKRAEYRPSKYQANGIYGRGYMGSQLDIGTAQNLNAKSAQTNGGRRKGIAPGRRD